MHILPLSASCIDLIFTNQPNLVINSGMHPLLHQYCHNQVIFAQINLKVYYLPPHKQLVPDYKKANIDPINWTVKSLLENAFNGTDINFQLELFNKALLSIFSNFIPNKIKMLRDSDLPWINDDIRNEVKLKLNIYPCHSSHKRNNKDFAKLDLHNEINNIISKFKRNIIKISTES